MARKIVESELRLPTDMVGAPHFDFRFSKLCDIKDWENPQIQQTIVDILKPADNKPLMHRKQWEYALTVLALQKAGLWHENSLGLSVAGGREELLYFASNAIGRVVSIDIYGEGEFSGGEATFEFLYNPDKFAPYPYNKDKLLSFWMNALDLKFEDQTFDFAYSLSSIEHFGGVPAAVQALKEIKRVTKPDALICISIDCIINGDNKIGFFTPEEVYQMIEESGLELIEEIDWSLSRETLDYMIDMERENVFYTPHFNLTAYGSIFTSLNMLLGHKKGAIQPAKPLGQNDLTAFDAEMFKIWRETTLPQILGRLTSKPTENQPTPQELHYKEELNKVSAWAEGLNSRLLEVEKWAGGLEQHIHDLESQKAVQLLKRAKLIR